MRPARFSMSWRMSWPCRECCSNMVLMSALYSSMVQPPRSRPRVRAASSSVRHLSSAEAFLWALLPIMDSRSDLHFSTAASRTALLCCSARWLCFELTSSAVWKSFLHCSSAKASCWQDMLFVDSRLVSEVSRLVLHCSRAMALLSELCSTAALRSDLQASTRDLADASHCFRHSFTESSLSSRNCRAEASCFARKSSMEVT
mmetsp:Transcript_72801/g.226910  ORF Transcript_72801/g.226910 Transcript_72801/m.226910 type:complete len:202 (+) Transcript_72801:897-1502(+)